MTKCVKCSQESQNLYKGLSFCSLHYINFLETRLYKQIRQHINKTDQLFLNNSPFNPILLKGLFRYFKYNIQFFDQLVFSEDCPDYLPLYQEFQPDYSKKQNVKHKAEEEIQLSAIPGQELAIQIILGVSKGNILTPVKNFKKSGSLYLMRDFSFQDCEKLGYTIDNSKYGAALMDASQDFEAVLGCISRLEIDT
ncbi:hypothetical protein SS50377_26736 [Spironucleus salmonicida]|uniref:Uncharacterized protein n=1 Tax=Spironucleus salmonicida TaxID=348837 RepID=V6LX60_9EUKA|nr:hypothetical protein SS50377_26736 [Spironucleus salmonicida]|eukprot:EST49207.1 Hypothetical protein SS50377_10424 [Spironucleus salmonicida]